MPNYHISLLPEKYYHIFSRAVGEEKLFRTDDNYAYFLKQFAKHILPVADVYAYCLLPNHFHFLVKIKTVDDIEAHYMLKKPSTIFQPECTSDFIMERFSNWLNGYTKAYNKMFNRHGSLFQDYLKRVEIDDETHFTDTLFYVHKNPVHHGLCVSIEQWPWTSYKAFLSSAPTKLKREEVLDWFGGIEAYYNFHQQPIVLKVSEDFE